MAELYHAVAAETGAFMHCVGALEIDASDLLHLSVELLDKNGSELSKNYPTNLSTKLEVLPRLVEEVKLTIESDFSVLDWQQVDRILDLRNTLAHAKITDLTGSQSDFCIKFIKISLPKKVIDGPTRQEVKRSERSLESEELRRRSIECMQMINEVEEIRKRVWRLFEGWPEYRIHNRANAIKPDGIIESHVAK